MTNIDLLLQQGITAARVGRRATARDLLMQVVEADERNETAWLWLSGVVDDPEEQRICLENVLEINPLHPQARRGLELLDARQAGVQAQSIGGGTERAEPPAPRYVAPEARAGSVSPPAAAPQPPPAAATPPPSAAAFAQPSPMGPLPPRPVAAAEPEHPCPFCGAPTNIDQRKCIACKNSLMVRTAGGTGLRGALGLGEWQRLNPTVEERDHVGHYNMGVAYKNKGMWYMAAKEWEAAIKRHPREVNYRHALGLAYAQLKQYLRALQELRDALALAPDDARIKESIAIVEKSARKES